MKARIPAIQRVSKDQREACREIANNEIRHAAYRMYLIACMSARAVFKIGEKNMLKFVDEMIENMEQYGDWASGDIADSKLFHEAEKIKGIVIDERIKRQMLQYESKRFWGEEK